MTTTELCEVSAAAAAAAVAADLFHDDDDEYVWANRPPAHTSMPPTNCQPHTGTHQHASN